MDESLAPFSAPVAGWFRAVFSAPTSPQVLGWPVIARGEHALIVSPTGSGKTLTAFLWAIDTLFRELLATPEPEPRSRDHSDYVPGVRVVYVSPLKALNNDVERNLRAPLAGIRSAAATAGAQLPEIRVAVRTGDTPAADRQRMVRRPPHILITTPESLYLMLTSDRARTIFRTTHTVIVDEIHTLIGTKRGVHLACSLERLERSVATLSGALAARPPQRIGLSATVRPIEIAARFLGGQDPTAEHVARPVTIVDARHPKALDVRVVMPIERFREMPGNSFWNAIVPEVAREIDAHRTTLVFCNSRRTAERTSDRLNEHRLRERAGPDSDPIPRRAGVADLGMFAAGIDARRLEAAGLEPIRAHHGSMSKPARFEMEQALKAGRLPALVCTSSLELGIDIGDVDLVVHLQSPKSVASGLQRVGRSGHGVGQTSVGRIYPTHVDDLLEAAVVCRGMLRGDIESTETPENALDVLAQQLVAAVSVEDWKSTDLFALIRGAYPFRNLSEPVFRGVLEMVSGRYPESVSRYLRPLIAWDRVNDRLTALPGSNPLAIGSGGTIPDRGTYALVLGDRRTRIGDLDEEFVFETRPGDTFILGSNVWRVAKIEDDRVVAEPAPGEVPRMPFWRGDAPWRPYDLGRRVGAFRRELAGLVRDLSPEDMAGLHALTDAEVDAARVGAEPADASKPRSPEVGHLLRLLAGECSLDRRSLVQIVEHVAAQLDAVGQVASDRALIVEVFADAIGEPRMVVHSPFGGRVNGPWGMVLVGALRERYGIDAQVVANDDGILLRFASAEVEPPTDLVASVSAAEARERLLAELPHSATFGAQFRMNAARALLLPRARAGKRTPLWLSRLRAKDLLQAVQGFGDFPILLETFRDCLRDVMDMEGLDDVLSRIERGEIEVVVHEAEAPSSIALGLDYGLAMQYVYEYDTPRGGHGPSQLGIDRGLLADLLRSGVLAGVLKPRAVDEVAARVAHLAPNERARDPEELAQLLYEHGDLSDDEIAARSESGRAGEWMGVLAAAGRALRWRFGDAERWIHAERCAEYEAVDAHPGPVLRRYLAHAGPTTCDALAARYALAADATRVALVGLGREVAVGTFTPEGGEQWVDRLNLEQMHRRSLSILRREVRPVSLAGYAEFLRRHHGIGAGEWLPERQVADGEPDTRGHRLTQVLQQLRGLAVPGVIWERDVLPARVPGYEPHLLAEKCQSGELMWLAEGGRDPRRARVRFFFRGEGALFVERAPTEAIVTALDPAARSVYDFLREEGAALLMDIVDATDLEPARARDALAELVLQGLATNDSLEAMRAVLGHEPPRPADARPFSTLEQQLAALRPGRPAIRTPQRMRDARRHARDVVAARGVGGRTPWVGRWSLAQRIGLLGRALPDDELALRRARQLLARWGVVSRACLERESALFDWAVLSDLFTRLEMRGEVRRGYFVDGLPGLQFALPEAVDQLRVAIGDRDAPADAGEAGVVVLSAADPAQVFGTEAFGGPLRFQRVASAALALVAGEPVAVAEDSGASLSAVSDHPALVPALRALARWWRQRAPGPVRVERWAGEPVLESAGVPLLEAAGYVREFGGMAWTL